VPDALLIDDLDVELTIMHTWDEDLEVFLRGPDNTRIELFTDVGGSDFDFIDTVLDDEADTPINSGTAPFTGRFRPEGSLAGFDGKSARGTWTLEVTDDESFDSGVLESWSITIARRATSVVGRHVFYNHSAFDGNDPAANAADDAAIAPDKVALLPGETATFANYSSCSRGVNGIMVDVGNLPAAATPGADDFRFRIGNDNHPSGWAPLAVAPSVVVRLDEGTAGSDRIALVWPDGAVQQEWLQVTVLATPDTGLVEDDVFYFGNAVGEAGNSTDDAKVNATDMLLARNNPHSFINPAEIDYAYDFNRDARVNATDMLLARNNPTNFLTALKLIAVPGNESPIPLPALLPDEARAPAADMAWLGQYEYTGRGDDRSDASRPTSRPIDRPVDRLLASGWL
jgi:subtilisin-like proprotein convertase family protein